MLYTKFKKCGLSGSEEEDFFLYISMHFYGLNLGPLARGHLGPWDLGLNKLGKGAPAMLYTKFQAPELSSSGEEDF